MIETFEILPMNIEKAGSISSYVKKLLAQDGKDRMIIRRVSIATYESEINVVIHSYGGKCEICYDEHQLVITFEDRGPGIANIDQAMQEGFSTASPYARENGFGAGMGLPNIKKACDEFFITSSSEGTKLVLKFNL